MATTTQFPVFTHQQEAVLTLIAEGASKIDAARRAGVHRTTIHNWEQTIPGYRDAVRDAQADYREQLESDMRELSALALMKLKDILIHPRTSPSVLLRAITLILKRGTKPSEKWALPEDLSQSNDILQTILSNVAERSETTERSDPAAGQGCTTPFDIRQKSAKNVENVESAAQSNRRAGVENVEFHGASPQSQVPSPQSNRRAGVENVEFPTASESLGGNHVAGIAAAFATLTGLPRRMSRKS